MSSLPAAADAVVRKTRAADRHAAITSNLPSWRSYKAWMESVRRDWDDKK